MLSSRFNAASLLLIAFLLPSITALSRREIYNNRNLNSSGSTKNVVKSDILLKVNKALLCTQRCNDDENKILAAQEACILWNEVLFSPSVSQGKIIALLPKNVLVLCYILHASCLVRIGKDELAIEKYDTALLLLEGDNNKDNGKNTDDRNKNIINAMLGKALSLQRLMKYKEARNNFLLLLKRLPILSQQQSSSMSTKFPAERTAARCVRSAATCSLRLGNLEDAHDILREYYYKCKKCEAKEKNIDYMITTPFAALNSAIDEETTAMLGTVMYLRQQQQRVHCRRQNREDGPMMKGGPFISSMIARAAQKKFPVYRCIYLLLSLSTNGDEGSYSNTESFDRESKFQYEPLSFLDIAASNLSPFDDSFLIHLDDKVLLHKLLTQSTKIPEQENQHRHVRIQEQEKWDTKKFWPRGVILPSESERLTIDLFEEEKKPNKWMCKRRSGYGSHGNQLVASNEAALKLSGTLKDAHLLQQMVDPPLLLQGRKFSLRIYVVYFGSTPSTQPSPETGAATESSYLPEVYISSEGLVKVAAAPTNKYGGRDSEESVAIGIQTSSSVPVTDKALIHQDENNRIHMTNSGRELNMIQYDLHYLEKVFNETESWCFKSLWKDIVSAVRTVMIRYQHTASMNRTDDGSAKTAHNPPQPQSVLATNLLGIPKILGFDFVIDACQNAWLLEVNRFPGLEPRDDSDRRVKYKVVHDSWLLAAERLGQQQNIDFIKEVLLAKELLELLEETPGNENQTDNDAICLKRIRI